MLEQLSQHLGDVLVQVPPSHTSLQLVLSLQSQQNSVSFLNSTLFKSHEVYAGLRDKHHLVLKVQVDSHGETLRVQKVTFREVNIFSDTVNLEDHEPLVLKLKKKSGSEFLHLLLHILIVIGFLDENYILIILQNSLEDFRVEGLESSWLVLAFLIAKCEEGFSKIALS